MSEPDLAPSGRPIRCGIHGTPIFARRCSDCDAARPDPDPPEWLDEEEHDPDFQAP